VRKGTLLGLTPFQWTKLDTNSQPIGLCKASRSTFLGLQRLLTANWTRPGLKSSIGCYEDIDTLLDFLFRLSLFQGFQDWVCGLLWQPLFLPKHAIRGPRSQKYYFKQLTKQPTYHFSMCIDISGPSPPLWQKYLDGTCVVLASANKRMYFRYLNFKRAHRRCAYLGDAVGRKVLAEKRRLYIASKHTTLVNGFILKIEKAFWSKVFQSFNAGRLRRRQSNLVDKSHGEKGSGSNLRLGRMAKKQSKLAWINWSKRQARPPFEMCSVEAHRNSQELSTVVPKKIKIPPTVKQPSILPRVVAGP